jgi:hypothetical protein
VAAVTPAGGAGPGRLTRSGAMQAAGGLSGVDIAIAMASGEGGRAAGRLALSRQPGTPAATRRPVRADHAASADADVWSLTGSDCREFLLFSVPGLTVAAALRDATSGAHPGMEGGWTSVAGETEQFTGHIRGNPRFQSEDVRVSEFLFTVDPDTTGVTDWGSAAVLMRLTATVADAAAGIGHAPILFMHSPVAPYKRLDSRRRRDGSFERPREATGVALRVALGVDASQPALRLQLESDLAEHAAATGLGLEVRDRRPGKVRGDWFNLVHRNDAKLAAHRAELSAEQAGEPVLAVRPVTIVGPARVGSTAACTRVLDQAGAGLVAVSITAVRDTAIINLVLPERRMPTADSRPMSPDDYKSLGAGLLTTAQRAWRGPGRWPRPGDAGLGRAAADYVLAGGRSRVLAPADEGKAPPERWAIWASWNVGAEEVLMADFVHTLVRAVHESLGGEPGGRGRIPEPLVTYVRARVTPGGRLRGRAKLAIASVSPPAGLVLTEYLQELCVASELRCREILGGTTAAFSLAGDIRIGWRERWLGQTVAEPHS